MADKPIEVSSIHSQFLYTTGDNMLNEEDMKAYKSFLATHHHSKFKTDEMLASQFDVDDSYELDDEDEPGSDWIKELMMDDEEWTELQSNKLLARRIEEKESNK